MAKHRWLAIRNGVYYLRARVPKELRSIIGKAEITYSLKTKCAKEARRLINVEAEKVQRLLDQAEADLKAPKSANGTQPSQSPIGRKPSQTDLKRICDDHYQAIIENDFAWRPEIRKKAFGDLDGFYDDKYITHPKTDWYLAFFEEMTSEQHLVCCFRSHYEQLLSKNARRLASGDTDHHVQLAAEMLKDTNLESNTSCSNKLARGLIDCEKRAYEAILAQDLTEYREILECYLGPQTTPGNTADNCDKAIEPGSVMSSLIGKFIDERKKSEVVQKTLNSDTSDLRDFIEIVGDKPIRTYSKDDGVRYKEILQELPSNRLTRDYNGLGLIQITEKLRREDPGNNVTRLHRSTINDKIGVINRFFKWADDHYEDVRNPVAGLRIKDRRRQRVKTPSRLPFTNEQLQTLLSGPAHTGCKSRTQWRQSGDLIERDSARFWAPLISLFSGMRAGEIIQLATSDIKEKSGIWHFDVTLEQTDSSQKSGKSLKNNNSVRQIPIHDKLFEFGLEALIKKRQDEKAPRLLMDYDKSPVDGSWSKTFSAWFRHYREHLNVRNIIDDKNRVNFHSFRHNFEDALRNLPDVRKDVRDAIQGHAETGSSKDYGTGVTLAVKNAALQQVDYVGLELTHLVP